MSEAVYYWQLDDTLVQYKQNTSDHSVRTVTKHRTTSERSLTMINKRRQKKSGKAMMDEPDEEKLLWANVCTE